MANSVGSDESCARQSLNMHGLLALIPSPVGLMLAGEFAEFRQIHIRQLPDVFRACSPFADLFKVEISQIDLQKIVIMQPDESLALLAALSGKPVEWAAKFADPDRISLLALLLAINEEFFKPQKPAPEIAGGKPAGKTQAADGWAGRIDALVAAGHRFEDVLGYNWSQFVALSDAAARRQKRLARAQFRLMLIAQRGNEDSVRSLLKDE